MNTNIYLSVKENLEVAILSGRIMPGQRLPSIRKLAEQFQASPNTVQRVMVELRKTGLVKEQRGQSMTVISDAEQISAYKQKKVIARVQECIQQLENLDYQKTEIIDLVLAITNQEM